MKEPTTVGLSPAVKARLDALKDAGVVRELLDGYRLGLAVALAHGTAAPVLAGKTTIFNVGTFDPGGHLYAAVEALREPVGEPVYASAERYAEWGIEELGRRLLDGKGSVLDLLREASDMLGGVR